jgi:hypothetical protein
VACGLSFIRSQGDPLFLHWIFPGAERGNQIASLIVHPNVGNAMPMQAS